MSSLVLRPHLVARCSRCIPAIPIGRPHQLRLATTAAKATKVASKTATDSVPKKKISTKSTAAAAPAKSPRKKAEPAVATAPVEAAAPAVKKSTRAASTKSAASAKKAAASSGSEDVKATTTKARKTTTAASKTTTAAPNSTTPATPAATPAKSADAPPAPKTVPETANSTGSSPLPEIQESIEKEVKEKVAPELLGSNVDTNSPEYKKASRQYTSVMVALPILLVTSYFLFDRLALGHEPKNLADFVAPETAALVRAGEKQDQEDSTT